MADSFESIEMDRIRYLTLCGKLESYLHSCLEDVASIESVACRPQQSVGQPIVCVATSNTCSLDEAVDEISRQLGAISRSRDDAGDGYVLEAVLPAIVKGDPDVDQQVYMLKVQPSAVHNPTTIGDAKDEPDPVIPFATDPNFGCDAKDITHVIAMVHGIHDIGAWHESVSSQLRSKGTVVEQIRYQLYPAIRFLFPIDLSGKAVKRVVKRLRALGKQYPNARMSIIAHSFGTYVTLKAIEAEPDLDFWKIIFCGSVANDQFEWSDIKRRIGDSKRPTKDFVLNDCGTGDVFPVLGATFGWHYGMAGASGFSEGFITNRFFKATDGTKGGHGLYFDPQFVLQHWRPFLIEDKAPALGNGVQGEDLPWCVTWLYHGWFRWICRIVAWTALAIFSLAVVALVVRLCAAFWPGVSGAFNYVVGL